MDASIDERYLKAWLALEILGGQAGIPLLLITLYVSPLQRLPTLYSVLWSCVVWSTIDLLLYYPGRVMPTDPQPSFALCLSQASLHYAEPVLTSWCAFALLYDSWIVISGRSQGPNHPTTIRRNTVLVLVPWLAFAFATAGSLLVSIQSILSIVAGLTSTTLHQVGASSAVDLGRERHLFFCSYRQHLWSDFTAAAAALALVASSFLTLRGLLLWRRLRREKGVSAQEKERHRINLHMFFRVLILGFTELLALVMCIVSISGAWKTRIADLVVAGIPFAIFMIFATQKDVLNVYLTWARAFVSLVRPAGEY